MKGSKLVMFVSVVSLVILGFAAASQEKVNAEPADNRLSHDADHLLAAAVEETLVICPFRLNGGDDGLSRGFYIQDYPGIHLDTVQVAYWTREAGSYTISMTARNGTYDGTIIGETQTVTVDLLATTYFTTTFDFEGALVSADTVTFSQSQVDGPGPVYYNTGPCGFNQDCTQCPGVYQTSGTTPPVDNVRRRSVAVQITQRQYELIFLPLVGK